MYIKCEKRTLTYDEQINFMRWARRNGLKNEFYFDCVTAVNGEDYYQPDIPGVWANGTMTFGEALRKLKKYFKSHKRRTT